MAMLGLRRSKILKNKNGNTSLNTISSNVDTSFLAETSLYCTPSKKYNTQDSNN